ncbi:beta-N-acetylhexosaminidase [Roseisolibacter agri]|uniref:beta-N-acetylhexosaminidase n=1 Tax=Roseisolibacter agri TaxID=2014610 RepID=A0AA37Q0L6_9BACT|nr:beta-N-acetylhexosaminidase [Roseisolibacter agri]GLC24440.1 beta-N-acetylhexosaminidase [Roseisolibacter agri]
MPTPSRSVARALSVALALSACAPRRAPSPAPTPTPAPTPAAVPATPAPLPRPALIPAPTRMELSTTERFVVTESTTVTFDADAAPEVERIARLTAAMLAPSVPREPRRLAAGEAPGRHAIHLALASADEPSPGDEGYALTVTTERVTLAAREPAGLFHAVQTLRQLLPVAVEHPAAIGRRLSVPTGRIEDAPRFAWRGAMLDVARHFLPAEDVKRFIDAMALYKLNRLHLHLSDDQGWRIEIRSWPNLAQFGGRLQVGGGTGGYYTQAQYAELVAYARDRFITVVPEIDMPGHTNAALSSYPALNCDGVAPPPYTGTRVGFSTLCASKDTVYAFVNDVVKELAALTPGPWLHIGGDEVEKLTHPDYLRFIERVEGIVRSHGKRAVGWGEIAPAKLDTATVVQHWRSDAKGVRDSTFLHAARGGRVVLSPARRVYLDMKYDSATVLGLRWAGLVGVRDTYEWNPATELPGVTERSVLGVEAPLWSETLEKRSDFEAMAFPRLLALAEVGWTPQAGREWAAFRARLGAHGARLSALGVNFHRAPEIPWVQ